MSSQDQLGVKPCLPNVLNVKNKSHAVTADLTVPDGEPNGVVVAQGGAFGG